MSKNNREQADLQKDGKKKKKKKKKAKNTPARRWWRWALFPHHTVIYPIPISCELVGLGSGGGKKKRKH